MRSDGKVQRNRYNHKEYPVLRNIPIPFTRIGIGFSYIPILFNRSRIAFLNILYLQNLYRILQNMKMQENLSWKALYINYSKYNFSRMGWDAFLWIIMCFLFRYIPFSKKDLLWNITFSLTNPYLIQKSSLFCKFHGLNPYSVLFCKIWKFLFLTKEYV